VRDAGVAALGFALGPAHHFDAGVAGGGCEIHDLLETQVGQDGGNKTELH